jgi:DNA polymerase-3 subunit epsilon
MSAQRGIREWIVPETPFAVVDFETTGLRAGADRVVELSVVRLNPGEQPRLVLDTLVNPRRPMAATEIHGITDGDVADAPTFRDIAGDLVRALSGCVVASYNVYFDVPFLTYELAQAGVDTEAPHLCVMYLRPMLDMGQRCCLVDACRQHGVEQEPAHMTSADALAAAQLMLCCLAQMKARGIRTFGELASLKSYKFLDSFDASPFSPAVGDRLGGCGGLKSRARPAMPPRTDRPTQPRPAVNPLAIYWDALRVVLSDLIVTDAEIADLQRKRRELGVQDDQVRALHARAFAQILTQFADDRRLDERECLLMHKLHRCLSELGWAPGETVAS